MLEKYADLVIAVGINLQQQQTLVVTAPIECAPFARIVAERAYKAGAREVVLHWKDELSAKIRFLYAPEEVFDEFPSWQKELFTFYMRQGAAFLSIAAADPDLLQDVNPDRIVKMQTAGNQALKEYRENLMSNKNAWCVVSIPTQAWAQKVFSQASAAEAVEQLWAAIFAVMRVDQPDPVRAWAEHKQKLNASMKFLNAQRFQFLQYKNSLGTDLRIELPAGHIWLGGAERTPAGVEFIANMPTEEVFTLPRRTGVNGTVVASKPLQYNGNLIDKFSLVFRDGKIVKFQAETGRDLLQKLIETDGGSCYLGEVALVPCDSPISRTNILFFNTLFDENASCHLALGKAYPVCMHNGENLTAQELAQLEVNDSLVHEDFMIGTEDLEIMGITVAGRHIPVFKDGKFAF